MAAQSAYPSWRTAREQTAQYSRRHPEDTPLYRIIYYHREQFEYSWEELFSERCGILRDEVLRAFDRYLDCGVLKHGCLRRAQAEWRAYGIFLDGGICPDGSFAQLPEIDTALLQEFFAEKVFAFLLEAELIDQDTVDSMNSWEHSGFNFFAGESIGGEDKDARLFLARYLKKAPLALERLSIDESGTEPVIRYTKPLDELAEKDEMMRNFSPLEFLAELSCHIPRVFEQTTRYFGVYSPRTRGKKHREERFLLLLQNNFQPLYGELVESVENPLPARPPSQSWARCMKLVFEVDPLLCTKCGSTMKIKAFIQNSSEIDRLCKHLGLISWRAPPKFWHDAQGAETIWLDDSGEFSQIH